MIEYHWSRQVGKFVDKLTGIDNVYQSDFDSWVEEYAGERDRLWCETLIEVVIDVVLCLQQTGLDVSKLGLIASPKADEIMRNSVLYGAQSLAGVKLECVVIEYTSNDNEICFVDDAGTVHGIVRILDVP